MISALFTRSLTSRLIIGWALGFLVSAAGSVFSFTLDLPDGAAIVVTFGAALLFARLLVPFWCQIQPEEIKPVEM